jgi:hypothetical protein
LNLACDLARTEALLKHAQNFELQFGRIDVGDVGRRIASRHERARYIGGGGWQAPG